MTDPAKNGHKSASMLNEENWSQAEKVAATRPKILDVDIPSYAAAVGHSAARRLAELLMPKRDPDMWFVNPEVPPPPAEAAEQIINLMGEYVCARPDIVGGETLFRKTCEKRANGYEDGNVWPVVAPTIQDVYAVFAGTVHAVNTGLVSMQSAAMQMRMKHQEHVPAPQPDDDDNEFGGHDSSRAGTFGGLSAREGPADPPGDKPAADAPADPPGDKQAADAPADPAGDKQAADAAEPATGKPAEKPAKKAAGKTAKSKK